MTLAARRFLPALPLLLLLHAGLAAVEVPPAEPPPATAFEFSSGGATSWALDPGQPSTAEGGVSVRYEGVLLQADRLTLRQSAIPGTTITAPSEVDLLSAQPPAGATATATPGAGQVLLDTRAATLATIGFKGLLTPSAVNIRRLPPDAARPGIVAYHVALPDIGTFDGLMQTGSGWAAFRGWARHAEFAIEGDLKSGALANLRVTRIVLQGRGEAEGDLPRRRAEVTRLKPGVVVPPLDQPIGRELVAGHLDAPLITITFDALGRPSANAPASNFSGDPGFLNLRELSPAKSTP